MANDFELFKGKRLDDVFEDIYRNQKNKARQISTHIDELKDYVNGMNDAIVIAPIIVDLINASTRNDESLVKLATIAQRIVIAEKRGESEDGILTAEEKKQLLSDIGDLEKESKNPELSDELSSEVERLTQKAKKVAEKNK